MMILQKAPTIFLKRLHASKSMDEGIVASATIETLPTGVAEAWETADWKVILTIPSNSDATFEQLEQQARQSLVENLRAVADAIEAEQYAQPEDPD